MKCIAFLLRTAIWAAVLLSVTASRAALDQVELRADAGSALQVGSHFHQAGKTAIPFDASISTIRLWDAGVAWKDLQPAATEFRFARLDRAVNDALARGLNVLYTFGLTPAWASSAPELRSSYGPGNSAPPADMNAWEGFVRAVARRYRGRIAAYEVWNEPNRSGFYSGTLEQLAEMTCRARAVIRTEDPAAILVGAAPTDQEQGVDWLEGYLSTSARHCIDAIGIHLYTWFDRPPEAIIPLIERLHRTLRAAGLASARVWNTEFGWNIANRRTPNAPRYRVLPAELARDYLLRSLLLQASLGVERAYHYSWDHRFMGAAEPDTGEDKAVVDAFRTARRWIGEDGQVSCQQRRETMRCVVTRGATRAEVAWSTATSATATRQYLDMSPYSAVENADGSTQAIEGRTLMLTGSPVKLLPDRQERR